MEKELQSFHGLMVRFRFLCSCSGSKQSVIFAISRTFVPREVDYSVCQGGKKNGRPMISPIPLNRTESEEKQ